MFPDCQFVAERTFSSVTVHLGCTGFYGPKGVYGRCVWVQTGREGIRLSLFPLFRARHPPFVIPWSVLIDCQRTSWSVYSYFSVQVTALQISGWPNPIVLRTSLWKDAALPEVITSAWHQNQTKSA